ncbi:MAG: Lpg1974 family pore-forming outer membrane protein [Rhizobiaceae bacterium]|nr:Lpg1974 family pore-forming outer membrane protein [Rhizobiaceae bacterium]
MKKLLATTTYSAAIVTALTSSTWSADFVSAAPASVDNCSPTRIIELTAGVLSTDNVWADEIGTLGPAFDKVGLGDAVGAFAELEYTWDRCESDLSIGAGFVNTSMEETGGALTIDDKVLFEHFDLEYGRSNDVGFRLFGGLRALNYDSNSNFNSGVRNEYMNASASFIGIGPRIGLEFNSQNRKQGQLGFFSEASVAALFGQRSNDLAYNLVGFGNSTFEEDTNKTVINFEAELGVSYHVTDTSMLKFGVAYKRLNDIDWVSENLVDGINNGSFENGDREFTGLFVGFESKF